MSQKNSSVLAATSRPSLTVLDRLELNNTRSIPEVKLDDIEVEPLKEALIEPGRYEARYVYHETCRAFGEYRVYIYFEIIEPGAAYGKGIYRAFRVTELIGKPGRNGRFKLKKRSELFLTLCRLYESSGIRPDRVSLRPLKSLILRVKVRTVVKDYKQRPLPLSLRYSVIDDLLSIEAGQLVT